MLLRLCYTSLQHRLQLTELLEQRLQTASTEHWWQALNLAGVPAGPVYSVPQVLAHPQIRDRGMLAQFSAVPGVAQEVCVLRTGFKVDGQAPAVATPPPALGQHTEQILQELGYDNTGIATLRQVGAC